MGDTEVVVAMVEGTRYSAVAILPRAGRLLRPPLAAGRWTSRRHVWNGSQLRAAGWIALIVCLGLFDCRADVAITTNEMQELQMVDAAPKRWWLAGRARSGLASWVQLYSSVVYGAERWGK